MTRKQAIRELKIRFVGEYDRQREAKDMAIKSLEQEPILDKLRAEIEQTSETVDGFLMHDETKRTVLKIIDKYKADTETEDGNDD